MKPDKLIQQDVEQELRWCPEIDSTDIAVHVRDGVVTLTGYARNYYEKFQAEAAAKRIVGVTAVADDLQVRLPACSGLTDPEIARATIEALQAVLPKVCQTIQTVVHDRHVTLEGVVDWNHQRMQAENVVRRVRGVQGVSNQIRVTKDLAPVLIKEQIEHAFRRRADLDASHVAVEANGSQVDLTGEVSSLVEREVALETAWATPGVSMVKDHLTVRR